MKNQIKEKLSTIQLVSLKDLLTFKRLTTLFISVLFLYWGIFSNFIYPIIDILTQPNIPNLILLIVKIFLLSGVCVGVGLTFSLITLTKTK